MSWNPPTRTPCKLNYPSDKNSGSAHEDTVSHIGYLCKNDNKKLNNHHNMKFFWVLSVIHRGSNQWRGHFLGLCIAVLRFHHGFHLIFVHCDDKHDSDPQKHATGLEYQVEEWILAVSGIYRHHLWQLKKKILKLPENLFMKLHVWTIFKVIKDETFYYRIINFISINSSTFSCIEINRNLRKYRNATKQTPLVISSTVTKLPIYVIKPLPTQQHSP